MLRTALITLGMIASGLVALPSGAAVKNVVAQAVKIEQHPYGFRGRTLSFYVGIPADERPNLPVVLFLEGDGTLCQDFKERIWRSFLEELTGRFYLVRPKTYLNAICGGLLRRGEEFKNSDFLYRLDELAVLLDAVEARFPGRPVYLAGHSAGADLAILFASRHPDRVAGLVNLSGGLRSLSELLPEIERAKAARRGGSRERLEKNLREVRETIAAVRARPDSAETFWGRTYRFWHQLFFTGVRELWASYDKPVLVLQGDRDLSGTPAAAVRADRDEWAAAGRSNFHFVFYPQLGHDLYKASVFLDIDRWLALQNSFPKPS
jgi:pimeloyl-ACP methyl ester carboxylesterase